MAADVAIIETNGTSPGSDTDITGLSSNYGSTDAPNLVAATFPLTPGQNSFSKWQRLEVTAMNASVSVRNLKFFSTAPAANTTHHDNLNTVQATPNYDDTKKTVYETPDTTTADAPNAVVTSAPGTSNWGIGGSLTGELTAPGFSDYVVSQIRTGAPATAGTTLTNTYR